jgi:hypothetical protein
MSKKCGREDDLLQNTVLKTIKSQFDGERRIRDKISEFFNSSYLDMTFAYSLTYETTIGEKSLKLHNDFSQY